MQTRHSARCDWIFAAVIVLSLLVAGCTATAPATGGAAAGGEATATQAGEEATAVPVELTPLSKCITFDSLNVGDSYRVQAGALTTISDSDAEMAVLPFQWSNGTWVDGTTDERRSATVNDPIQEPGLSAATQAELAKIAQLAAGTDGREVFLNNTNLGFNIEPLTCVTLRFHDNGGSTNLVFKDNVVLNSQDFSTSTGDVNVTVTLDNQDQLKGELRLEGAFEKFLFLEKVPISFAIGGQELTIDNICPCQ